MKQISLLLSFALSTILLNAQTYTTSNFDLTNSVSSSGSESHTIAQTLAVGESVSINFTVGDISPTTGSNTVADTLFYPFKLNVEAVNATDELQLKAEIGTDSYEPSITGSGVLSFGDDFYVVENKITPVLVTNTGSNPVVVQSTKIFGGQYVSVISNVGNALFGSEGSATYNNPIAEDILHINLPSDIQRASVQLLSMSGDVLLQQEITPLKNTIDLSKLSSGVYLLRDINTASVAKIILN